MDWNNFNLDEDVVARQIEWETEQRFLRAWQAGMSKTKIGKLWGMKPGEVTWRLLEATQRTRKSPAYSHIQYWDKPRIDQEAMVLNGLNKLRIVKD